MHTSDPALTDVVLEHVRRRLAADPAPLGRRGDAHELAAGLDGAIGAEPLGLDAAMRLYVQHIEPTIASSRSPRYLAYIPAAPTPAATAFDMLVSAFALHGDGWEDCSGAIAAENQALRVIADRAGLPAGAGGCFVSGGSAGNLSALVVARDSRPPVTRPRIAVTAETHSSVANTLRIIGVEPFLVPVEDHRLTGAALRAALLEDEAPETVIAVVATAGTTNAGIIDDLEGIAEVARELGIWFHIDAAYGGGALFSDRLRPAFAGIEHADAVVIDPHKWLFTPFDCGAVLYRDPAKAAAVHTQEAEYLGNPNAGEWNPSDYAYHLTRRARGLPLWFSLATYGIDAYGRAVDAGRALALATAALIEASDQLELVREPGLSVVLFRRHGWGQGEYEAWGELLFARGLAYVAPTKWEGRPVGRLVFIHPDLTLDVVREILATLEEPTPTVARRGSLAQVAE
ncbi:pyridoxal phosphate-dependent decarboxylase family protein [Agromyces mediolanus]|uniref:Glutamate decarboxylase n=1 Tax=Agromyces mediolanus TaxID=41986 RepID=A0A918CK80_AGRME|nr:aminotransferase class I/II-fold pyridoxal phosphate-dependent enzyme [Agromyces mediolanus]GGR28415.1 glutamate decarboxylase [Agromyces mediolanus]GLJ72071.1 glutamate decarboxylase [Agromyces mediolanus]